MTCVRFFAVPDLAAHRPAEHRWCRSDDASTASTRDLAQLVLAASGLPPTAALWLRTGSGWEQVSSLAEVPGGDLIVMAVVGQPGGQTLYKEGSQSGCGDE